MYSAFPRYLEVVDPQPNPEAAAIRASQPTMKALTVEDVARHDQNMMNFHNHIIKDEVWPDCITANFHYTREGHIGLIHAFRPRSEQILPVLVFYHGGGYTTCKMEMYDFEMRSLCIESNCLVLSVDYPAALDGYTVPEQFEDCYAALLAIAEQAATLNGDANKICVMGDSAGGDIAGGMSVLARDRKGPKIHHQFLMYPGIGFDLTEACSSSGVLNDKNILSTCFHDPLDSQQRHISLMLDERKSELPPTTFFVGTCDFLLDATLVYAKALSDSGVPVRLRLYDGIPHGFILYNNSAIRDCFSEISKEIEEIFS